MFKTIVAVVDGSDHDNVLAQKASGLARFCEARLVIAHVADPGAMGRGLEALASAEHLEGPEGEARNAKAPT